jgi:hypothetical protein
MVMTGREEELEATAEPDISDVLTLFLIEYLQENTPAGTLEEIHRRADQSRHFALENGAEWTPYSRRRSILEATGVVLGGPDALMAVGRCVFDSIRRPERMEIFQTLGSPAAVYEVLPSFIEVSGTAFRMATNALGPTECRIEIRMREANEPFPELCAFGLGLASTLPQLFGCSVAEVIHESCQCDGAECCSALLRWESADRQEAQESRADMRVRLLEARLESLQSTVAELG